MSNYNEDGFELRDSLQKGEGIFTTRQEGSVVG